MPPSSRRNPQSDEGVVTSVSPARFIRAGDYAGRLIENLRQGNESLYPLAADHEKIPVGTRWPAMSSRKNGKPILLREVLWAGPEPIDDYEFYFDSQGRRYRLVAAGIFPL